MSIAMGASATKGKGSSKAEQADQAIISLQGLVSRELLATASKSGSQTGCRRCALILRCSGSKHPVQLNETPSTAHKNDDGVVLNQAGPQRVLRVQHMR